jgi:hypothetical protein
MSIPSNIYANRIYSEHPISIYPLDDESAYYSFISDEERLFDSGGWSVINGVANDNPELPGQLPVTNSSVFSSIDGEIPESEHTIEWQSPGIFRFEDLSQRLNSFSISFYLYQQSSFVDWYEFGYVYYDQFLSADKEIVTRVEASPGNDWLNFSFTYSPSYYDNSELRIIMRAKVKNGGGSSDYSFIVHGLSVGQWSETTSSYDMGVFKEESPIENLYGYPAKEYGIQENSGYYIIENNELLAKNISVPMVYGSENSTKISSALQEGLPSLIIPANGFFNALGKYKDMSCEFWLRISPQTILSRRIFGPVGSKDGLYVRDNTLSLVVGNSIGSNSIYQWNRPMIVHIMFSDDSASLLINGEIVINMPIDKESSLFNQEDWVAFYSYSDIENFDIDCFSLYPYLVPAPVAKRRFAWGQATSSPQTVTNYYQGQNTYVNFSNSGYDHNISYPDFYSWSAGKTDNLIATRNRLSSPEYSLPNIEIGPRSIQELYFANKQVNIEEKTFFTFRPNESWSGTHYMYLDSLNFINSLSSIYGVFSSTNTVEKSPLMTIKNISTNDKFEIYLENDEIFYKFNSEMLHSDPISPIFNEEDPTEQIETLFAFGFNVLSLSQKFRDIFFKFFESKNSLQIYIAGNEEDTFGGRVYRFGITNKKNVAEISNLFDDRGFAISSMHDDFYSHFATYTVVPLIRFDSFVLDISISASWEEYFPLAKLGKFIKNSQGKTYYDLDYMQINFDYSPVTDRVEVQSTPSTWTYEELFNFYNFPVQQEYEILDNELITGYGSYDDLNNKKFTEYFLSTEKSSLKSYITFQLLSDGSNISIDRFPYTRELLDCCFIDAEIENTNESPFKSYLTKFEFIDKTVIYPPQKIDFRRVAAVIHVDIKQEGILTNPVNIRNLEICSRSFSQYSPNAINTESGVPLFPYVKRGIYFNYKAKNPIRISKTRNPYLYLSEDSGIKILGKQTLTEEVGIAMPINQNQSREFSVQSLQIWIKQNIFDLPAVSYPIFEIEGFEETVEFVIRSDSSGKRAVLAARDKKSKSIKSGVSFYQNGIRTKSPYLEYNEWICLGISFDDPIIFDNYVGYLNLFRGIAFNNISYFDPNGMGKTTSVESRNWLNVLNPDGEGEVSWEYWYEDSENNEIRKWVDVYVLGSSEYFSITPQDIYETFVGTNNIVFDDGDQLDIKNDSLAVFQSSEWSEFRVIPA